MPRHESAPRRGQQAGHDEPAGPYASRAYHDLPSVTPRAWGAVAGDDDSFGPRGLGGYGDFREPADSDQRPARAGGPTQRGRGPRQQTRPDTRIADEVYRRLTDDERIDAREILLAVEDGVVTLTGEVPQRSMKHLAEDVAAEAGGVRDVRNCLSVDDGRSSFGPAGRAVRSGNDQLGSGFSSSERTEDEWREPSLRAGRVGQENPEPEQQAAHRQR